MNNRETKNKNTKKKNTKNEPPEPCDHKIFVKYCKSCRIKRKEEEKGLNKKQKFEKRQKRLEENGGPIKKYHKSKADRTKELQKKRDKKRDKEIKTKHDNQNLS